MAQSKPNVTKPVIVFDFDGTLVDTYTLALSTFYDVTHHAPLPDEDISRLRGLSSLQLKQELGIRFWQLPLLAWQVRRRLSRQLSGIDLMPGMAEAVQSLAVQYNLFILTSNSSANVHTVLRRLGIARCFVGVYGNAGILHKERTLRQLLRRNQLEARSVWYVGDEARDIDAARHVGMPVVAVSWGFNNIAVLERHHPDKLVFSPEELAEHFEAKL